LRYEFDTASIRYVEYGEGRPIVFLHGWTTHHRLEVADYENIFATRGGWRRIYPDLPGMGASLARDGIRMQDDILAAILAFIDQVVGTQRFLLAGTSLGAYLARAVAARRRAQIAGLLLRVPCIEPDNAKRTLPPFQPLVCNDEVLASLDPAERSAHGGVLIQTPDYLATRGKKLHGLIEPAIAGTAPIANEIRTDPRRYAFSFDLIGIEKSFEGPTLIIAGRQDITVGYRDAWGILESYPRATFAVIDQADHEWPVETPNLLGALVEDWLHRIELAERGA
jgi:pimeloyl-ACP methyl ester carboxylesterase